MPSCLCLHLLDCFLWRKRTKGKEGTLGWMDRLIARTVCTNPFPSTFLSFCSQPVSGGHIKERKEKNELKGKCRETKLTLSIPGGITLFSLFTLTVVRLRSRVGSKYSLLPHFLPKWYCPYAEKMRAARCWLEMKNRHTKDGLMIWRNGY